MVAEQTQKHPTLPEVMEELKKMTDIGFPILAMSLVTYLKNMISVMCMGRIGSLELAGGALAIGFTNITGNSILSGLAMGMEPLCSQAFGSRNLTVASLTLQRTILMLLFASIPIAFLWLNLEPLMLMLNQKLEITQIASLYCRYIVPDLVTISLLQPLRIYLRNKGTIRPLMWSTLFATFLHLPITFFLAFALRLGVKGIALSTFITNFNTLFLLLAYVLFSTRISSSNFEPPLRIPLLIQILKPPTYVDYLKCTEKPIDSDKITHCHCETTCVCRVRGYNSNLSQNSPGENWGMLLSLAIPSCLGVCLEWWWYELILTLVAGYLYKPDIALATSAIVIQTTSLMYILPSALSASISTRVGYELGAGRPAKVGSATTIAIGLALLTSMLSLLGTTIGKEAWGRVFTKDGEVLELAMDVLPILGLCELANCPQTTCCGVLRGSARPNVGAGINFYSFYLVGTPVAIALAFVWKLEFVGLCYGLLAAQVTCLITILTVIYKTNWEEESTRARDLVGGSSEFAYAHQTLTSEEGVENLKEVVFEK